MDLLIKKFKEIIILKKIINKTLSEITLTHFFKASAIEVNSSLISPKTYLQT